VLAQTVGVVEDLAVAESPMDSPAYPKDPALNWLEHQQFFFQMQPLPFQEGYIENNAGPFFFYRKCGRVCHHGVVRFVVNCGL
jgi:hypothetical protein